MPNRTDIGGAVDERLFFAQVREDPRLELEALADHLDGPIAIVSSGGCTALSLIAAGAGRVTAIDLNRNQNHLVELKSAALATLGPRSATAMLGGVDANPALRQRQYAEMREQITLGARRYWDARPDMIGRGVLGSGVTERTFAAMIRIFRLTVHPRRRIERLLALPDVAAQREFYDTEWNTRAWQRTFDLMFNRFTMNRTYDPVFFAQLGEVGIADHFRGVVERTLTELPVRDNYFLHFLVRGCYPADEPGGLPPYLVHKHRPEALSLVDGTFADYLRSQPDSSISGFSLSNICEWLDAEQIDDLFAQIVRTAAPGARLCFRNFLGWTEVPEKWRELVRENRGYGEELMRADRSLVQRRFAVCDIGKEA
jgi:S-adenosylmethionine-diacylglycerol 3-amino-3-carboxypropyl transferase